MDEMGFGDKLHSSNSKLPMSALGHKETFSPRNTMSALPPKADMVQRDPDVRFVPKADTTSCLFDSQLA
jgi:hypothetical protein